MFCPEGYVSLYQCSKKERQTYPIRPHHGMCLAFFIGNGYSTGFTAHMQEMLELFTKGAEVQLVMKTDEICSACPNNCEGVCEAAEKVKNKELTFDEAAEKLKYFSYYKEAYSAVLGGLVGEYEIQESEGGPYVKKYGLKAFSPIAKGFPYSDYDDFGVSRSYGYKRQHLGHDMMGQIGTPVICIETGYVEALGWNQYGGWRVGIRSPDKKRYYYYAHLRQDYPYQAKLKEGDLVTAGDVIGYMGHTGYSTKENVNNIDTVHLHYGLELIFDEEWRESGHEIWVDCYNLTRFLYKNRSEVHKVKGTKEWKRTFDMKENYLQRAKKQKEKLEKSDKK